MKPYEKERAVAIDAVIKACRLCQEVRAGDLFGETMEKKDKSPVTVADFGAQGVISLALLTAFPGDPIVAEEALGDVHDDLKQKIVSYVLRIFPAQLKERIFFAIDRCTHPGGSAGRFWCIDPIDGTKGFLRNDQYAIALALIEAGEVVLGVLGCPSLPWNLSQPDVNRGCIFAAVKGQGAWMRSLDSAQENRISVAAAPDPAQASFCESVESAHTAHNESSRIASRLGVVNPPVRIDSQCKYGIVARGDAAIYLRIPTKPGYQEKIWDHAAGWMIITEAGGTVTDIHGAPLDFSRGRSLSVNAGIVASNGAFHSHIVSAVEAVLKESSPAA